jgi:hypothetical protein
MEFGSGFKHGDGQHLFRNSHASLDQQRSNEFSIPHPKSALPFYWADGEISPCGGPAE